MGFDAANLDVGITKAQHDKITCGTSRPLTDAPIGAHTQPARSMSALASRCHDRSVGLDLDSIGERSNPTQVDICAGERTRHAAMVAKRKLADIIAAAEAGIV